MTILLEFLSGRTSRERVHTPNFLAVTTRQRDFETVRVLMMLGGMLAYPLELELTGGRKFTQDQSRLLTLEQLSPRYNEQKKLAESFQPRLVSSLSRTSADHIYRHESKHGGPDGRRRGKHALHIIETLHFFHRSSSACQSWNNRDS